MQSSSSSELGGPGGVFAEDSDSENDDVTESEFGTERTISSSESIGSSILMPRLS